MTRLVKTAFFLLFLTTSLSFFSGCEWGRSTFLTNKKDVLDDPAVEDNTPTPSPAPTPPPDPTPTPTPTPPPLPVLWGLEDLDIGLENQGTTAGLSVMQTTLLDDQATAYGTFQSHNQKVVSNKNGLFMTHIRSRNKAYTAQQWRLSRSVDGGETFKTLYEETHGTNPPLLETDENDNLYLVRGDFPNLRSHFYKFSPTDDYKRPTISVDIEIPVTPKGTTKSSMIYDPIRKQLYYLTRDDQGLDSTSVFYVLDLNGAVKSWRTLTIAGQETVLEYPLLSLDETGVLYAAWTTVKDLGCCQPQSDQHIYVYHDIHFAKSLNGGEAWQKMDGTPLPLPMIADNSGPTDRVSLDDEFKVDSWLANFKVREGKAHFLYLAYTEPIHRQHYVRINVATGVKEKDFINFKGETLEPHHLGGCFASNPNLANGPLYVTIADARNRLLVLASDDGGNTWYDYAQGDVNWQHLYAVGCARDLTSDGMIVGSFTDGIFSANGDDIKGPVYAFRVRAGRASVEVTQFHYADGLAHLSFGVVHGQPTEIRFSNAAGIWSPWSPFSSPMTIPLAEIPTRYQLKSQLNVVSREYRLPAQQ